MNDGRGPSNTTVGSTTGRADRTDRAAGLRALVAEHAPDGRYPAGWNDVLARSGYVAPHWPAPWGLDADPNEQLAIDEVMRELAVPRPLNPIGIGWAGPTLLVAGTEEQQRRWLPGVLDGSEIWCQLFSEPEAGSDLASLQTTARRDGDEYVVNGQKVWTTLAHVAQFGILLARTDPDATAQEGITYFVVDMRSAGDRGAPARADDRHARVQRGVLHRRARSRGQRGRPRTRRLAAREGDARQRTGIALGRGRTLGTRPDRERRRRPRPRARRLHRSRRCGNASRACTPRPRRCG